MCVGYECKRIWFVCEGMRVRVCLRQQFRAAQSMLGSLSLQIMQGKITQVHRGENHPPLLFCLSLCLHYSLYLFFFSHTLTYASTLLHYLLSFVEL